MVYHIEHNLHIERCTEVRHYTFNGEQHKYYPDFITDAGVIEIKGIRIDDKTRAKLLANPDVILIDRNAIWEPYLNYVVAKYGWRFYEILYDTNNSKKKTATQNIAAIAKFNCSTRRHIRTKCTTSDAVALKRRIRNLYKRIDKDYTSIKSLQLSLVYECRYNAIHLLASTEQFNFQRPTRSIVNAGICSFAHTKEFVIKYMPELAKQCRFIQRSYKLK